MPSPINDEDLIQLVRSYYCIVDSDGHESKTKINKCVEAVSYVNSSYSPNNEIIFPEVKDIPRLSYYIKSVRDIPKVVRKFYSIVHDDKELLALSFRDPLLLATEKLGIAITPIVARVIRAGFRKTIRFDQRPRPGSKRSGIKNIEWKLKMDHIHSKTNEPL